MKGLHFTYEFDLQAFAYLFLIGKHTSVIIFSDSDSVLGEMW